MKLYNIWRFFEFTQQYFALSGFILVNLKSQGAIQNLVSNIKAFSPANKATRDTFISSSPYPVDNKRSFTIVTFRYMYLRNIVKLKILL